MTGRGFPCSPVTRRAHSTVGRVLPSPICFSPALDSGPEAPLSISCLLPQQEKGAAQLATEQWAS